MTLPREKLDTLIALRRDLHKHPETAFEEHDTAQRIVKFLENCGPDEILTELGGTGVAAVFRGKGGDKKVMIRAELDALPIAEVNDDIDYKSVNDGRGHKCGHDGHMAILCGLAQKYGAARPDTAEVVLLFQPAEETGQGARAVVADDRFAGLKPDYAFALHNLPDYPRGAVICRAGVFSLSVESMEIAFSGTTAHAAQPQHAVSMVDALPRILDGLRPYLHEGDADNDFACVAVTHVETGKAGRHGTAAANGAMSLSLRAASPDALAKLKREVADIIDAAVAAVNDALPEGAQPLSYETEDGIEAFTSIVNDADAARMIERAAQELGLEYVAMDAPNSWGEDWSMVTGLDGVKGAMFGLGSATVPLHSADYDWPDDIIEPGVAMFAALIGAVGDLS